LNRAPQPLEKKVDRGSLGPVLRRLRLEAQMSQEELAELAHLSVESISALERGRRRAPYRETLRLIADALRLSKVQREELESAAKRKTAPVAVVQYDSADAALPVVSRAGESGSGTANANNLPSRLSSFVGRESEVAEITALVASHRLVTVTGSGGVGKTRTSLEVAAKVLEHWSDGVWFVELGPLSSGDHIAWAVAYALGLTPAAGSDAAQSLLHALRAQRALLVFDNCEHLNEAAARVIAALLDDCPDASVLASSRQALGIAGEAIYRMPSLPVPDDSEIVRLSEKDGIRYAAIALFVERARQADHRFTLSDENAPVVAEICRRLDGIPLAIELAAARANILSPWQLRERLDQRFRVLTGGNRNALPHQQTLRALIDWSYDLLDERERALFRRLGTFVNSFSLEGAAAVCGADDFDLLDVLASLVNKSLVLAEPAGDARRYRMLESSRFYAREKLAAAGERDVCADRHLRYLQARFAAARGLSDKTGRRAVLDDAIAVELEEVRAALNVALVGSLTTLGGEMLADIGSRWTSIGLGDEGLARVELFLAVLADADARLRARLFIAVAWLAQLVRGVTAGIEAATQAVAYARASGDLPTLAEALLAYSLSAAGLRRFDDAESALAQAEAIEDVSTATRLRLLGDRAYLSRLRNDLATAADAYEQLRAEHRVLGNTAWERAVAINLAEVEHARGRTPSAIAIVRELLPGFRGHSDRTSFANVLANLSGYLVANGDPDEARAAAREAIAELAPRDPEIALIVTALEHLALTLLLSGDFRRAAVLAGYVDATYRRHGVERESTEQITHDRLSTLLRERFSPAALTSLKAEGAALAPETAVFLALEADP
jgi:predicted ATPase/transcriptional regulator with XRE-family HTH domain